LPRKQFLVVSFWFLERF